ncbi:flavin reductase family protein [Paraburkholderia ferrariae]|uniref:flavin reductase family protein n=1 Tax=Paraburkholderia ferrariae TaxID=386056 RepID=UPI0004896BBA|nr:flavin reductase family protein [Paraburkholderia ferrariae]
MTIEETHFKAAMRRLAGHVCLITTCSDDGERGGLTATAVCSVSANPPLLLVCINRANTSCASIQAAARFAVNVLPRSDQELAQRFARPLPPDEKFAEGEWRTLKTGAPILASSLASFDCKIERIIQAGTHDVIFGHVEAIATRETNASPLLYASGAYGELHSPQNVNLRDLLWISNWGEETDLNF